MSKIAVIGDGGWGTALAVILSNRAHQVHLWSISLEYAKFLSEKRENVKFLPGIPIPKEIEFTGVIEEAVRNSSLVILAVPSKYMRSVVGRMKNIPLEKVILVSVAKGLEQQTLLRMSEVICQVIRVKRLAVLSGPTIAYEVAKGYPAAAVAASEDPTTAKEVQENLSTPRFRLYTSRDVIGVELGGALKNVIAIAAGISDGLGFGSNAKAALLARGLGEITKIGVMMGAKRKTFSGLSGLGDLVTTCLSERSRNRSLGEAVGKGRPLQEVLKSSEMVVEGVDTVQSARQLTRKIQVEAPLIEEVYSVLFEGKDPRKSVDLLMTRPMRAEF